ncbi:hypothetical protein ZTR_03620 [Talaromyces verruculosus]|nr:hypothetical protein ZTR_03620 [Talaromyces verruculosus]
MASLRTISSTGVDVVLNSLAGEALRQTWLCVAPFGRFIELGKKDIVGNTGINMSPFMNNIIFAGVKLLSVYRDNIPLFGRIIAHVMKCLADAIIRPVQLLKMTNFSQIVPQTIKPYSLPDNATYAQHIVFTSQPGTTPPEAQKLIAELHKLSAKTMAFACDISKVSELQKVLTAVDKEFPPVKGIITCAMQLQDVLYENMSVEKFHAAVRPKPGASLVLEVKDITMPVTHSKTPSLIIANHRPAHEQRARRINLGVILGIGITAQRGEILSFLKTGAMIVIHKQEVLATIQAAIAGQLPAQVFVELATGGILKQNGHDDPFWFSEPSFGPLRIYDTQKLGVAKGGSSDDEQLQTFVGEAKTMTETTDAACTTLVRKLAKAMMIEVEDLDSSRPANSYGVDSLVAVKIHAWIFKEVKSDVSIFEIRSNTPLL